MAFEVAVAERGEWSYSPAVGIGPLRFGMTVEEVVEAPELLGQTKVSECARHHATFSPTWKVRGPPSRGGSSTTCRHGLCEPSREVVLYRLRRHARSPQVAYDRLPLVGRDLSELERDEIAYAEAMDLHLRYRPKGFAGPDDPGVILRGQLVGQVLRSRPLFMLTRDGANTEWDSMPSEEYYVSASVGSRCPLHLGSLRRGILHRCDHGVPGREFF
ncbi:hypothetical protein [Streptomyces sp. SID3343]|uniref:hypothetical protein n=1 Tax=Streptomyces sp. SID3343 TaxID=2690260 RepID=UPI00136E25F2|nr:hypothetical protein [Streptomyces sp. SID3343]MYV97001.1 hypothetical protein [Streptomyces sp. SID3343]